MWVRGADPRPERGPRQSMIASGIFSSTRSASVSIEVSETAVPRRRRAAHGTASATRHILAP